MVFEQWFFFKRIVLSNLDRYSIIKIVLFVVSNYSEAKRQLGSLL